MRIGIIDADLIYRKRHRFPNLACMKISSYYKTQGHDVSLLLDYDSVDQFDKVFISKVFIATEIPGEPQDKSKKTEKTVIEFYADNEFLKKSNIEFGGTGFFYDEAPPLPVEIEQIIPDYQLYTEFVLNSLDTGTISKNDASYYLDYSIGFTTRGCIRGCSFCVNQNSRICLLHSSVSEFMDPDRKYICLLDDNVLACKDWKKIFEELNATGKRFRFHQGMDERLLTDEKCEVIFNSNWHGDFIFAFDNIKDRRLVERKLQLIRRYMDGSNIKFYCFCGYNHDVVGQYNQDFWTQDIADLFERIKILMNYNCLPYIMRHENYKYSPYRGMYITIAMWCNQPNFFKKKSFREYCESNKSRGRGSSLKYMLEFENEHPEIAEKYFDIKWVN